MSYKFTDFPYLLQREPEELKQTIFRTLREYRGNVSQTSEVFGITKKQFYNYIHRLEILPEVQGIRDEFSKRVRKVARIKTPSTEFMRQVEQDPKAAAQIMLWAYKDAKADVPAVCRELGLARHTLFRLAEELGIAGEMQDYVATLRRERRDEGRRLFGR